MQNTNNKAIVSEREREMRGDRQDHRGIKNCVKQSKEEEAGVRRNLSDMVRTYGDDDDDDDDNGDDDDNNVITGFSVSALEYVGS
jgi:hypothetical protein